MEKQATIDHFKFKPIGVNHGFNHKGTEIKVGQANAGIK